MNGDENTLFGQRDGDQRPERTLRADQQDERGLVCSRCGCRRFEVYYVRQTKRQSIIRRRRCEHCGKLILTVEKVISDA